MTDVPHVLVVDASESSRRELCDLVQASGSGQVVGQAEFYAGAALRASTIGADLVIVGLDADPAAGLAAVAELGSFEGRAAVLPSSRARDGALILQAFRAGAREFLTLPSTPEEFRAVFGRAVPARRPAHDSEPGAPAAAAKVVAVAAAVGGAGCTTVAVNLAARLAADASRFTVLADFDLIQGCVNACLDLVPDVTVVELAQQPGAARRDPAAEHAEPA